MCVCLCVCMRVLYAHTLLVRIYHRKPHSSKKIDMLILTEPTMFSCVYEGWYILMLNMPPTAFGRQWSSIYKVPNVIG